MFQKYIKYKSLYVDTQLKSGNKSNINIDNKHDTVIEKLSNLYTKVVKSNLYGISSDAKHVFPTYGTMLDSGLKSLVETIQIKNTDVFVDFGSGMGNVCFYINLMTGAKTIGIEFIEQRHSTAESVLQAATTVLQEPSFLKITFIKDNFVNFKNFEATIIFTNSIMFDKETLGIIQDLSLKCNSLRYLISSQELINSKNFTLLKRIDCPASWGNSHLYIYEKCV